MGCISLRRIISSQLTVKFLENTARLPFDGDDFEVQPDRIAEVLDSTACDFVLDIGHAHVSAVVMESALQSTAVSLSQAQEQEMEGRCIWCNEKDEKLKEIKVMTPNRLGLRPREGAFLVHPEHEQVFQKFNDRAQQFGAWFIGLVGVAIIALLVKPWSHLVTGALVVFVGVVFWVFPFATPETVRVLGVKAATEVVRVLTVLVIGIGVLIALGILKSDSRPLTPGAALEPTSSVMRYSDSYLGFAVEYPIEWEVTDYWEVQDPTGQSLTGIGFGSNLYLGGEQALGHYGVNIAAGEATGRTLADTVEYRLSPIAPELRDKISRQCCLMVDGEQAMELTGFPWERWGSRQSECMVGRLKGEHPMQTEWEDIVFLVLWGLSFGILWRLSIRLHNPSFGRLLWDLLVRAHTLARRLWVFSAETTDSQEAEFIDEHPVDLSAFLPWLARALLSTLYLLVLLAWIVFNNGQKTAANTAPRFNVERTLVTSSKRDTMDDATLISRLLGKDFVP